MTKKVLILVLSCNEEPWISLLNKQKETWDSINIDNVKTLYYYANPNVNGSTIHGNDLILKINETKDFKNRIAKLKMAFESVLDLEWDFIFRTNSSSYIDKKRLLNFAQNLPLEKCYCGIPLVHDNTIKFATGCGYFISRDYVEFLIKNIDEQANFYGDDVYISALLGQKITTGATLMEIWDFEENELQQGMSTIKFTDTYPYHYRCKTMIKGDRSKDILAFDAIHRYLTNHAN